MNRKVVGTLHCGRNEQKKPGWITVCLEKVVTTHQPQYTACVVKKTLGIFVILLPFTHHTPAEYLKGFCTCLVRR